MREVIKVIVSFIVWSLGAVFVLGVMITATALDFFGDLEDGTDEHGKDSIR